MCFKIGDDELETVKGLMTMTVYSVISDVLNVDLENIEPQSNLAKDLGMNDKSQKALSLSIMEMFDDLVVDFSPDSCVQNIIDQVLQDEFDELEYNELDYFEPVH